MKATEVGVGETAMRVACALLVAALVSCGDDDNGTSRRADDAGLDQDAAVACVLTDGGCPTGCGALEARTADPTLPDPCFGEPETLACRQVHPDAHGEVPVDACLRSKDGHWISIVSVGLGATLLKTGNYVECTEAEFNRLRDYHLCEQ